MAEKKDFWIAGKHSVVSALMNRERKVREVYFTNENKKILNEKIKNLNPKTLFKEVSKNKIDNIFTKLNLVHQNFAAKISPLKKNFIQYDLVNENKVLILDRITDARNIGSIIRSSVAFNFDSIIVKERNFPSTSPLMYKSSSGAIENIKIFEVSNLSNIIEILKKKNFWIYALDSNAKEGINENTFQTKKKALILGSESRGISNNILNKSDYIIKIDISDKIESLNVSNAATAIMTLIKFYES